MRRRANHCHESDTAAAGRRRGTILIVVLWISSALVVTALLFGHSMMMEYRAAESSVAGFEAMQAIEGARRYVAYFLKNSEEPGMMPDVQTYESEAVPIGDAQFWLLGRGTESTNLKNNEPVFGLVDEASKLNLNTVTREMLEMLPCMTPELAAAIIDWRDSDTELTPDGAETQNYLLRTPKYNCKDSEFETVEELRLLAGADWTVLMGEDTNMNGVLDPNEDDGPDTPPEDDSDGTLDPGVLEYVTVWSREPAAQSGGTEGEGTEGEGTGGEDSNSTGTRGLINVNTASAVVLACIPGIGREYAEQLVSYREGKTDELTSTTWVSELIGEEAFQQAAPYITTHSYQFSADITAVGRDGRGFRRILYVIDVSSGKPVVLYRRDRSRLGWPLGTAIREELVSMNSEGRL